MLRNRFPTLLLALALMATACSGGDDVQAANATSTTSAPVTTQTSAAPAPTTTTAPASTTTSAPGIYDGYSSEIYSDSANWICRPGADDVCAESLDITLVNADGSTEVVEVAHATSAPVDCFYVYPTVSGDPTLNSDLVPGPNEEISTTLSQAARFGSACDVYAPVYRQTTIGALFGLVDRPEGVNTQEVAYADAVDAFRQFIANDSDGRGFILLGHSQGAGIVRRLIEEEIDDVPELRERLVSVLVLGTSVGRGDDGFGNVPPCSEPVQIGCVISFMTFDEEAPPPPDSFFGRTFEGTALCTNPAALEGGPATLRPQFVVGSLAGGPFSDPSTAPEITTAWVEFPDFVTGVCVDDSTFGYLSVSVDVDPSDPRTDDLGGRLTPQWGLHILDGNIALGDLVDVAAQQISTYVG